MKNLLKCLLLLVSVGFISAKDCSKDEGAPCGNQWKIASVKWVLSHDSLKVDGKKVVLVGKITKKQDEDTYFLNDGTGTIELDSDINLPVGQEVVVHGRIDYAFFGERRTQFNVHAWRLASEPGHMHYHKK
ncbi:MAG: NirD/YgiW/YdeI family stress tolerance protein [Verrucomicrobiota bacterium]